MKIIFFDKNKELCELAKSIPEIEVKNCDLSDIEADAVSTASNPDFTFGGGIDAIINKRFNLKKGNWLDIQKGDKKIKNVVLNITVNEDLKSTKKLIRKAYANFFNLAKNNKLETVAVSGFGCGVGGLSISETVEALREAVDMYLTIVGYKNVEIIDIVNVIMTNCDSAKMTDCYYATMTNCDSATMTDCYYATMTDCYSAKMTDCYYATMTNCDSATMTNCYSATMTDCYYATMTDCYSATMTDCYCIIILYSNECVSDNCYILDKHKSNVEEKNIRKRTEIKEVFLKRFKEDNKYYAYKFLTKNWESPINDKKIKYETGKTYKEDVNKDLNENCGTGIHLATLNWCKRENNCNGIYVKFEFDIKDAIVPYSTNGKFRVSKCKCIGKIN